MPNYVVAYHGGGKPETPEEGQEMMAARNQWIEDMGDRLVEPGNPVGKSWTVSADAVVENGGPNPLMGYTPLWRRRTRKRQSRSLRDVRSCR